MSYESTVARNTHFAERDSRAESRDAPEPRDPEAV